MTTEIATTAAQLQSDLSAITFGNGASTTIAISGTLTASSAINLGFADTGVTIDGTGTIVAGSGVSTILNLNNAYSTTLEGFTLTGASAGSSTTAGAISITGGGSEIIQGMTFAGNNIAINDQSSGGGDLIGGAHGTLGNTITNSGSAGILLAGVGSDIVENNTISGVGGLTGNGASNGGIDIQNGTLDQILYNNISNTKGASISVNNSANNSSYGNVSQGETIEGNYLTNADTGASYASGDLYILGGASAVGTLVDNVSMNFISQTGTASNGEAVYFGGDASNISFTSNIVQEYSAGAYALVNQGGHNITESGNIIDLGSGGDNAALLTQTIANASNVDTKSLSGNSFTDNIVQSESSAEGQVTSTGYNQIMQFETVTTPVNNVAGVANSNPMYYTQPNSFAGLLDSAGLSENPTLTLNDFYNTVGGTQNTTPMTISSVGTIATGFTGGGSGDGGYTVTNTLTTTTGISIPWTNINTSSIGIQT